MTEDEFDPTGGALALDALPPQQSGLAAGANQTLRQAGVAVGIAALGTAPLDREALANAVENISSADAFERVVRARPELIGGEMEAHLE